MPVLYQGKVIAGNGSGGDVNMDEYLPKSGGVMWGSISTRNTGASIINSIDNGYFLIHNVEGKPNLFVRADESDASSPMRFAGIDIPAYDHDAANKLYVDSLVVRQNLTDNSYFPDAINQRGKQSYTDEMSIDRWKIDGGTLTVETDGISISTGESDAILRFTTEKDLFGKTITLSVLTSNNELFTGTGVIQKGSDWTNYHIVFASDVARLWLQQVPTGLYSFSISLLQNRKLVAYKAELGSTQTLAHKEGGTWVLNEIPNRVEEFKKCKEYLYVRRYRGFHPQSGVDDSIPRANAFYTSLHMQSFTDGTGYFYIDIPKSALVELCNTYPSVTVSCSGSWGISYSTPGSTEGTMTLTSDTFSEITVTGVSLITVGVNTLNYRVDVSAPYFKTIPTNAGGISIGVGSYGISSGPIPGMVITASYDL